MRTLRARLLWGAVVGTGLVLLASAVALFAIVRSALWSAYDESLVSKARSLAALVEEDEDGIEFELDPDSLPEFKPSDHASYYQFRLASGETFARSPSLGEQGLPNEHDASGTPTITDTALPDGRKGRAVQLAFAPRQEEPSPDGAGDQERAKLAVVVARETRDVDVALNRLLLLLVFGGAGAIVVSAFVLSWSVRRGLLPLDRVAGDIARLDASDLSQRIKSTHAPAEVAPVVERLNDLLARLEAAFARERAFTADVAHELRTPLASLRTTLEVALSRQRGEEEYRSAAATSLAVSKQMQHLVENLLELARADAGQLESAVEKVDLARALKECWADYVDRAADRNLQVEWRLPDLCVLDTDATKLRFVLSNLLDNATTYADTGGSICIELRDEPEGVILRIENTGSKVDRADASRVFDRFWRGDEARSRETAERRYGLGLPLCRQLVTFLGGTIEVSTTTGGVFSVSVCLPM